MSLLAIVLTLLWTLTPEQRTLRAKKAAFTRWANEDGQANAVRAQKGLYAKFEREAAEKFPDLTPVARAKRAEAAYHAHMVGLALKSSTARAARKGGDAA